jgi:hypothetical protein
VIAATNRDLRQLVDDGRFQEDLPPGGDTRAHRFVCAIRAGAQWHDSARHPEALIYEVKSGRARLVGVEYIVPVEAWRPAEGEPPVPVLEGQVFHFNESPNRFGLPAFYELHVWAWRNNPKGTFADWNPQVSCDRQ